MALAGHASALRVAASDATGDVVAGLTSISFGPSGNLMDITDFSDTSGAHKKLLGLVDCNISGSGLYESADTGQALIRSSWASGADIYIRFLPNGSTGYKCACKIQDYKIDSSVDGTVTFSFTAQGNGALGTV